MKKRRKLTPQTVGFLLIGTIFSITFLYPIAYMFISSLKSKAEFYKNPISLIPEDPSFQNYATVFSRIDIPQVVSNTLIIVGVSILLITVLALLISYTIAIKRFRGRNWLYSLIIATMFIPIQVTMIPTYVMFAKLGMINKLISVILVYTAGGIPSALLLLVPTFKNMPHELIDAAIIDGASQWQIMLKIAFPLGKAAIAINAITLFIGYWNDLFTPLILLNDNASKTVMVSMASLMSRTMSVPTVKMAGMFMSILPTLLIYVAFQKYIVKGLTMGSTK